MSAHRSASRDSRLRASWRWASRSAAAAAEYGVASLSAGDAVLNSLAAGFAPHEGEGDETDRDPSGAADETDGDPSGAADETDDR
jgi:hypothetical protein